MAILLPATLNPLNDYFENNKITPSPLVGEPACRQAWAGEPPSRAAIMTRWLLLKLWRRTVRGNGWTGSPQAPPELVEGSTPTSIHINAADAGIEKT